MAWLACALWCAGFELAPLSHVAFHGALGPHDHARGHRHDTTPDSSARHTDADAHTHADEPAAGGGFSAWRDHGHRDAARSVERSAHAPHTHRRPATEAAWGSTEARAHASEYAHQQASEDEDPLDHGEGSLAHRDLAALLPLPGLPPVPEAPFAGYLTVVTRHEGPRDSRPIRGRARAPPTHLTSRST